MRVRVPTKCDLRPSPSVWVDFKAGEHTTKRAWGEQLIAEGKAVEIKAPRRKPAAP